LTATTALWTPTFWNVVTFRALTMVVLLMTTLFTMRGPPHPHQKGVPMKPTGPHHGKIGSPNPSAAQPTNGKPIPTFTDTPTGPKNVTSAGA